jgi:hypothetical protein
MEYKANFIMDEIIDSSPEAFPCVSFEVEGKGMLLFHGIGRVNVFV